MIVYHLYVIRHGITQANLEGRYIGSTDEPLCSQGRRQIEELAETIEYPPVQKVYTSPLLRAKQTARLIYPHAPMQSVPELSEYHFGPFENQSLQDLANNEVHQQWMQSGMQHPPEGAEAYDHFARRITEGLNSIWMNMISEKIPYAACVGHAGVLSALIAQFGMPRRSQTDWQMEPGKGYTLATSTQMWTRDHIFEVYDPVPFQDVSSRRSDYYNLPLEE